MLKKLVIGGAVVVVLVLVFAGYRYLNKPAESQAFVTINAVWAVQGPFKNGAESAQAMRYATKAVGGADSFYNEIDKHAAAYDAHPLGGKKSERQLSICKGSGFETSWSRQRDLGSC